MVSPVRIDDTTSRYDEVTAGDFASDIVSRSRKLTEEIRRVAHERGVLYADAAQVARAGDDGLHFTLDSHRRFAQLIAETVTTAVEERHGTS